MSLVICKKINNLVYIESDSRVTDINEGRKESLYGVLKAIILFPRLCLSFAGNIYLGERVVKEIYNHKNVSLEYLLDKLLKYNKGSNNGIEFILSTINNNKTEIIKISNYEVERNLTTAWIGDSDGFNDFQKHFHELKDSGKTEKDSLTTAFLKVIENPNISTVGDFHVSTITETSLEGNLFFLYSEKFMLIVGREQRFSFKGEGTHSITMNWGSAEDGSYAICFFVSVTAERSAIAYYFTHGNFGVLFYPKLSFEGIVIKNTTNREFLEIINEKYNIKMRGFIVINNNTAVQLVDMRFPEKSFGKKE
jgi:hypothetical protein